MTPLRVGAQPLTSTSFAPYGEVVAAPEESGRQPAIEALSNDGRPFALSTSTVDPARSPIEIDQLERHPYSSQTFIPLSVERWLVVVSQTLEPTDLRAFIVGSGVGVTIGRGIWHYRLTALDQVGRFAVVMWKSGDGDDDFRSIEPVEVHLSPSGAGQVGHQN